MSSSTWLMAFTNGMILPPPSQSSDAICYMIYWSGAVILTAVIWRQGSTCRMKTLLMGLLLLLICQQLGSAPSSTNVLETRVVTMSSDLGNLTLLTKSNWRRGLKTNSVAFQGSKGFQSLMSLMSKILLMRGILSIRFSSWRQFCSLRWLGQVLKLTHEKFIRSLLQAPLELMLNSSSNQLPSMSVVAVIWTSSGLSTKAREATIEEC